jgi:SWI/SNF-related matrix-associated actin-dependent regulator of chromatin subfamily D
MYQDLLEMERKLDWTMTRKRVEVQDALGRIPTVSPRVEHWSSSSMFAQPLLWLQTTRTLRIFLSHTVSGQLWQNPSDQPAVTNFETGEGIPAWAFKIEGRLLEVRRLHSIYLQVFVLTMSWHFAFVGTQSET